LTFSPSKKSTPFSEVNGGEGPDQLHAILGDRRRCAVMPFGVVVPALRGLKKRLKL
jgi:hypothetical protein